MKNVTLSAEEAVIERARERARQEKSSLNQEFRRWLDCDASGSAPLRLLALPRVVDQGTAPRQLVRRLSPAEARAVLPSLLFCSSTGEASALFALDAGEPTVER